MNNQIEKVVSLALGEVGYTEEPKGSNKNKYAKEIDALRKEGKNVYNYPKNSVAWCDIFHDWLHIHSFGFDEGMYHLCQPEKSSGAGCKFSAQYYKNAGRWFDNPEVGDQIFFYVGSEINHTGIVTKVDDKKVYTVEGNSGDMVKAHSYNKDGNKKIAGYGRPRWEEEPSSMADTAATKPEPIEKPVAKKSNEEIAREVIAGKWGNGNDRKSRLTKAGYDYDVIQKIVNKKLGKSSKPAVEKPSVDPKKTFFGVVKTERYDLNVRCGAAMNCSVVRCLKKGSTVELFTQKVGDFYKLANGKEEYVHSRYIVKK